MNDIIKLIKSLKDSGVLTNGITETVKYYTKNKKLDFFERSLLAASLVQPVISWVV